MGTFTAPQPEALSGTFKITKTPEGWAVTVDNKTTDFPNLPELHNFVTATLVAKRMEKK